MYGIFVRVQTTNTMIRHRNVWQGLEEAGGSLLERAEERDSPGRVLADPVLSSILTSICNIL